MRIAACAATLLLLLTACSTTSTTSTESPFDQPNQLMGAEIDRRIDQIPYLHREELLDNLLWLGQTGEQCIPALLKGLNSESPKVRSSSAWVLGRLRDRRTIPALQMAVSDSEPTVQFECARTLVLLGDLEPAPVLIGGLDSERKEVRYLCHEALKTATGHDFGFDHLAVSQNQARSAVYQWRQWWSDYSGDQAFAMAYAEQHGLGEAAVPATPMGEMKAPSPTGLTTPMGEAGSGDETMQQGQTMTEKPMSGDSTSGKSVPGASTTGESMTNPTPVRETMPGSPIPIPSLGTPKPDMGNVETGRPGGSEGSMESESPGKATVVPVIEIPVIEVSRPVSAEGGSGESAKGSGSGNGNGR